MSRLRVAHVITRLELGGAQGNTLYTVGHLDRNRFEPHLISGRGGMLDPEAQKLPEAAVHFCESLIREIRPWPDWKAYRELKRLFTRLRPDIVHTHSSKAGILGRLAARHAGVPIIVHTYHGFGFHRFQNPVLFRLLVKAEKVACRRTNHLVFVSRDNWRWADRLGLTEGCSTSLIRSGIQIREIQESHPAGQIRREFGIPEGTKLVGMIACLKPQKDPLTFVAAARMVQSEMPDVHFLLAGDGELQSPVREAISKLPEPNRFHMLGWRRDVFHILRELNVFVLTSLWEGLPRVIPEATLSGVPVVASDIDGNREAVVPGRSGWLARAQDPADFASRILQVLREGMEIDPDCSRAIRGEYDIDDMINRQQDLYWQLSNCR